MNKLRLAALPIPMGAGENLFAGHNRFGLGYHATQHVSTELAMHVLLEKLV